MKICIQKEITHDGIVDWNVNIVCLSFVHKELNYKLKIKSRLNVFFVQTWFNFISQNIGEFVIWKKNKEIKVVNGSYKIFEFCDKKLEFYVLPILK